MPVFNNPRRVIVETGGAGNELLIGLVLAVAIGAGVVWLIEQLAVAIFAVLMTASAACTAYLVYRLRKDGPAWRPDADPAAVKPPPAARPAALPEPQRRAIEAPKLTPAMVALAQAIQDVERARPAPATSRGQKAGQR